MEIISRAEWGAVPPKARVIWNPDLLLGVAVHHFAKPRAASTLAGSKAQMRSVQAFHMGPGGLGVKDGGSDIAYNHCVDKRGAIFEGRGFNVQTGANGNGTVNRTYASVCYMGDSDLDGFPEPAQDAIAWVLKEWFKRGVSVRTVAHGDISPDGTACPGNAAENWVHSGAWRRDLPSPRRVQFEVWDDSTRLLTSRAITPGDAAEMKKLAEFDEFSRKRRLENMQAEGKIGNVVTVRRVLL
jgi:hypothetical protein